MKNKCLKFIERFFLSNLIPGFFSVRTAAVFAIYTAMIVVSFIFSYLLRFDFNFEVIKEFNPMYVIGYVVLIKLFFLIVFGQFRGLLSFFHVPDLVGIFWAMGLSALSFLLLLTIDYQNFHYLTRGIITIDFIISMMMFFTFRLFLRSYRERMARDLSSITRKKIAIVGAGELGTSLAADLISHKNMGLTPTLFLDDDPNKIGHSVMGIPVLPLSSNFSNIKNYYSIDTAVIAIARLKASKIGEIASAMKKAGVETNLVPSYHDLAGGRVKISRIREIEIEDVLGREAVSLDSENIDSMIKGRVIMVTGAGGSIGSELCRQIASRSPSLVVLVDHCEVQLFKIEQDLLSRGYGTPIRPVVGSVTDTARMNWIMKRFSPEIVFHAAAHKHVPMMESQPGEALKNNAVGTWRLADCSSRNGVKKFVLISTDKAINPANVMGATKRLAEMEIQAMQSRPGNNTIFTAVRFGNVLGSSGSVVPTFKKQISEGGPVTVTHPEVTRYFMTIPEAVGLVLQCGAQAVGGEIFVLDMGKPVKVIELARQLIRLSGFEPDVDIQIKIIGLRPGEKLYEELQHKNESLVETKHPRIFGFMSTPPTYEKMSSIVKEIEKDMDSMSVNELKRLIFKYVPEYRAQFYD